MRELFSKLQESEENHIQFWALFGPFFILLGIGIASFRHLLPSIDLWILFPAAIALIWIGGRKGLLITEGLLALLSIGHHIFLDANHLWQIGLECNLALGFLIMYAGFEEVKKRIFLLQAEKEKVKENLLILEEEMRQEQTGFENKIADFEEKVLQLEQSLHLTNQQLTSSQTLIEIIRKTENQNIQDRKELVDQCLEARRQRAILIDKLQEVESKLAELARSKEDLPLLVPQDILVFEEPISQPAMQDAVDEEQEQKAYLQKKELALALEKEFKEKQLELEARLLEYQNQLKEKESLLETLQTELVEAKNAQALYKQLQAQFREKKVLLHEARKALFQNQEKFSSWQNEKHLEALDLSDEQKAFSERFLSLLDQLQNAEEEISHLEGVVTALNPEPKKRAVRKKKVAAPEEVPLDNPL